MKEQNSGELSSEREKELYSQIEELRSEIERLNDTLSQQEAHILNMGWPSYK